MIKGGSSYVFFPPEFSNDGKRLLVCTGNTVTIFSTSTGLKISELEGHTALVSSVIVVPASGAASRILCYCWTASLDGTIRYWDFSVPEMIKKIDVRMPIFSMVIPSVLCKPEESNAKPPNVFAYISVEDTREEKNHFKLLGQIRKCNLTKSRMSGGIILKETERPEFLTISPSGKFLGIRNKRKLHIWKLPAMDSDSAVTKKITLHHTKTFTVLAFHPTERIVAAGDVTGRILIWRGFGMENFPTSDRPVIGNVPYEKDKAGVRGSDDAQSCTTWHWHPSEVRVLYFSSDGAYLYSGGNEGVLVVWQLDTGKKKFLPRIGSQLLYFKDSPDPSLSSISCADNQIHMLKMPSMEIMKSISGIKPPLSPVELCKDVRTKVGFDCSTGLVALSTDNYCIQLYSLFDDREVYEVQACERNHQPGDEVTIVVTSVVLSPDGSKMGTVETRLPEEEIGGLICLKFWELGTDDQRFSLSTLIYEPHRDAGISAVAFHPTHHMAVSSSYGGDFKIWVCKDNISQKGQALQNSSWMCHAVGSYKKKPMTAATFSPDGSVLAVAAETVITLWDPEKNVLVAVVGETLHMPISALCFAGKSEFLVSVSRGLGSQLSVWNMSKLTVAWSYRLNIEAVACASDSSSFAVLTLLPESNGTTLKNGDGIILLFNATDPVPVASWSVKKAWGGELAFIQGNSSFLEVENFDGKPPSMLLAYVNGDHEYVLFDPTVTKPGELSITKRKCPVAYDETGQFGYASLYGELPEFDMKKNQTSWVSTVPSERPWETIFSGSSHNLPPLTKLCSEFLESLLEKRTVAVE